VKCLVIQPIHEEGLQTLRTGGVEPVMCPAPDMRTVAAHVGDCDAVITRDAGFSAAALAAAPRLRAIVVHGTGTDPVDIDAATARGVLVCNTPGANAQSVAEMTLGLALSAARGIPAGDRRERAGQKGYRESGRFTELHGKTALVVGWGSIGARVGRLLHAALGMEILIHSPVCDDDFGFARIASLDEGLARADLVSLHAPLTAQTRGMISGPSLAAIKPGAILVNTARAGLVDEAALARALADGRVRAAALDVYSAEAPTGQLAAFPDRVIFTPHLGGTTEDSLARVAIAAAGHVLTACAGGIPATTINRPQERVMP
jgi:D-3-phosphoglycerate dehydrogenase / 2-oxoglutarate reductase